MPAISEKWEITVGRKKYIISGEEMKILLNAGETRFVRFRDLVINPAFVSDMVLIEKYNPVQIEAPPEIEMTIEQHTEAIKRIEELRKKHGF